MQGVSSFRSYFPVRLPAWSCTLHIRAVQSEVVCVVLEVLLRNRLRHTELVLGSNGATEAEICCTL